MLDAIKVSIVLPTINAERFLRKSIDSCLEQTHQDLELIVVDGGSVDATLDIVRSYEDPRIILLHQESNTGRLPGALNIGFANASGKYFSWTQADDYYTPDAIEVMLSYLTEYPEVGMVYAGLWEIDEVGIVTRECDALPPENLIWTNPVGHCFLYRREVADEVGEYNEAFLMSEDSHYWMRIFKCVKMATLPGHYYFHRLHSESLTVKDYGRYQALRVAASARRMVLGISLTNYQKQVAAAFIEEAFAAYSHQAWDRVRSCLASGLLRNPAWLKNRGVVSIGIESIIGSKIMQAYRQRLKGSLFNRQDVASE